MAPIVSRNRVFQQKFKNFVLLKSTQNHLKRVINFFFCENKFLNIFSTGWDLEKFRKCTILRDIPCLELDGGTALKKLNC